MVDVENRQLKQQLSAAQQNSINWQTRYRNLQNKVQPYLDAMRHAPERVRNFFENTFGAEAGTDGRCTVQSQPPEERRTLMLSGCKKGDLPMMNDRTFPIPSNTISVKFEDYTNKSLQMDSNPATMEVSGASCRSVRAKFSAYSRVIRKAGCASHAQKHPRFGQMCKRCAESV